MSQTIWTRCGARSNCCPVSGRAFRVVEAQHVVSTRKLVDDLEEQAVLEDLIETAKPPLPEDTAHLHWLLATPFRYPPLRHGSRFGRRHERGILYASLSVRSALTEAAYYRLLFLEGTEAELRLQVELTVFTLGFATPHGIDLCKPPFDEFRALISSRSTYRTSQPLGSAMRADGVEAFLFFSARDRPEGINLALIQPAALSARKPGRQEAWVCHAERSQVDFVRNNLVGARPVLSLPRSHFEVSGVLPSPGL